jgi:hypothetical protein
MNAVQVAESPATFGVVAGRGPARRDLRHPERARQLDSLPFMPEMMGCGHHDCASASRNRCTA